MSDDFRRRRRLTGSGSPRRGGGGGKNINPWIVTIFAALAVIAGGWFLGQALARVFNGPPKTERVAQAPTAQPVVTPPASASPATTITATASPSAEPTTKPKPTPEPTPTAAALPTPVASAAPTQAPTAAPTQAPSSAPAATPTTAATAPPATRRTQPIGRRTEPSAASAPQVQGPAADIVRSYINALRDGNPAQASSYLGNGSPDESFIDSATRISSISQSPNGDGSYKVSVDMQTAKGEYYETFTVASGKILDKTAIKP